MPDPKLELRALTTRGRAFLAAGCTVVLCAVVLGYDALMRVGILVAALPLLTAWLAGRARYRLMAARTVTPSRVSAGEPATVQVALRNEGAMPMGMLLLEDHVPYVLGTRARFLVDRMRPRWRQTVGYTVRSEVRGHYEIGPLTVRMSDPFGLIEVTRAFRRTTPLVVIPTVVPLPAIPVSGSWAGTGENRPRAFAVGSAEDVTVREYRRGDDLRRVHWRSTARVGDLMVRREEQPWQSRASVLLDSRSCAHRGVGPASSLEWAVSAAASVAVHLAHTGAVVRLITDRPDVEANAWHDKTMSPTLQVGPILDELAVLRESPMTNLTHGTDALAGQPGLIVAILGAQEPVDLVDLSRAAPAGSKKLAILLDTSAWSGRADDSAHESGVVQDQVRQLERHGWSVTTARPEESIRGVWQRLGATISPAETDLLTTSLRGRR